MNNKNIVLLSGLLCDETVWLDIKKDLISSANVFTISFKACSSIEEMAKKVLSLSPDIFHLVGHSMGARVAIEIMRIEPKRVEKLALFNTGIHNVSTKEIEGRHKLLELAKTEGMAALKEAWLNPMMSKAGLQNKELMEKLNKMLLSYNLEDYEKQLKALINRPNAKEVLESIKVPTLLLSGTEDKWSPISQHEQMKEYLTNSELVVIKNAGHMAPCEFPHQISKLILKLL